MLWLIVILVIVILLQATLFLIRQLRRNRKPESKKVIYRVEKPMFYPKGYGTDVHAAVNAMVNKTRCLCYTKEVIDGLLLKITLKDANGFPLTLTAYGRVPDGYFALYPKGLGVVNQLWLEQGKMAYDELLDIIVDNIFPNEQSLYTTFKPFWDEIYLVDVKYGSYVKSKLTRTLRDMLRTRVK
jgi:hypothetical protein